MFVLTMAVALNNFIRTDSRVFCGDGNASPWKPLGYSCPINCHNIVHAINKLRLLDYEYLLKKNYNNEAVSMSTRDLEVNLENHLEHLNETHFSRKFNLNNKSDKNENAVRNLVTEYIKIFENKKVLSGLKVHLKRINYERAICSSLAKKGFKKKKISGILTKCNSRRYNSVDDYLYEIITNILNRHTTTIKFTINMTKILLRKIFGPNTDLRNGFLDVNLILQYLRHVLSHLEPRDEKPNIKLKTQHCFNLHISGCYCKPGFVENSGRCVVPANCSMEDVHTKYLDRILVY